MYQVVDQRTDLFVRLGSMHGTKPGLYLIAPASWEDQIPARIAGVFRFDTRIAVCIPRVFMDDTDVDRVAIQPVINQVMMYPLREFTGQLRSTDWTAAPVFPAGGETSGEQETQWVDPARFFAALPAVLAEVPARPGEEAWYGWLESVLQAAADDPQVAAQLTAAAMDANAGLVAHLFQFRNIGLPLPGHWSTQDNGARFGTDYLSRTAMGKANIFVNPPEEASYFYQDLDEHGERLDGSRSYAVTFPPNRLPPVRGFWSLTLYNEHHFFHSNELDRYSLGTKNKNLHHAADGSLTLIASAIRPPDDDLRSNWLPAFPGRLSVPARRLSRATNSQRDLDRRPQPDSAKTPRRVRDRSSALRGLHIGGAVLSGACRIASLSLLVAVARGSPGFTVWGVVRRVDGWRSSCCSVCSRSRLWS